MKVRYTDKNGNTIIDVSYDQEYDILNPFPKYQHRGNTATWNFKPAKITEIFYGREEIVIKLDCEKVIPKLKAVTPKPTVKHKKKKPVLVPPPVVPEAPAEVKIKKPRKTTKKKKPEAA